MYNSQEERDEIVKMMCDPQTLINTIKKLDQLIEEQGEDQTRIVKACTELFGEEIDF